MATADSSARGNLGLTVSQGHFEYRSCKATVAASEISRKIVEESRVVDIDSFDSIPRFDRDELLKLGKLLGRGGFSDVYEILSISAQRSPTNDSLKSENSEDGLTEDLKHASLAFASNNNRASLLAKQFETKKFIAQHCTREDSGEARYAIKYLKKEILLDCESYPQGAADIMTEALYLSSLRHPNIIKLRGISSAGETGFESRTEGNFFLILDWLYDTLGQRIKTWNSMNKQFTSFKKILDIKGCKRRALLAHRLHAAYDLTSALAYLHSKNIIYRDLKPENIGFDIRDDVKLFDLGLVREFNPRDKMADGNYQLTGNTGSRIYMAPEIVKCKPYNLSADVYSFGILLWEICTLKEPFRGFGFRQHEKVVVYGGLRPKIPKSLPPSIKDLIQSSWSGNVEDRLSFVSIMKILKNEIITLRDGSSEGLGNYRRRSTYVQSGQLTCYASMKALAA